MSECFALYDRDTLLSVYNSQSDANNALASVKRKTATANLLKTAGVPDVLANNHGLYMQITQSMGIQEMDIYVEMAKLTNFTVSCKMLS